MPERGAIREGSGCPCKRHERPSRKSLGDRGALQGRSGGVGLDVTFPLPGDRAAS